MLGREDIEVIKLLLKMQNANAWIEFTSVQANADMKQFEYFRADYAGLAITFQVDYDNALKQLNELLEKTPFPKIGE